MINRLTYNNNTQNLESQIYTFIHVVNTLFNNFKNIPIFDLKL